MSTKLIDTKGLQTFGEGTVVPIKKSIAETEVSPATVAHAVGEYIMYGNALYKVIAEIETGDDLVVDTNIEATTVTDEIGDAATINVEDVTNDKTYAMQFQLYQGKPRLVYEEVE